MGELVSNQELVPSNQNTNKNKIGSGLFDIPKIDIMKHNDYSIIWK